MKTYVAVAILLVSGLAWASSSEESAFEALKQKYPFGEIYLAPDDVINIYYYVRKAPKQLDEGESLIGAFISTKALGSYLASEIAVLYINLKELKAAYLSPRGNLGVPSSIPWTEHQVKVVALWVDTYLGGRIQLAKQLKEIESTRDIQVAWNKRKALASDPYATDADLQMANMSFIALTDADQQQTAHVKKVDEALYSEIVQLKRHLLLHKADQKAYGVDSMGAQIIDPK